MARTPEPLARAPLHTRRRALRPSRRRWRQRAGAAFARSVLFSLTAALSTYGIYEAYGVVSAGGVTPLEGVFLAFFGLNFTWVAYTLVQCALGFLVAPRRERQAAPSASLRTALLIPIYEEDARTVVANALAMAAALASDRRSAGRFAVYLLSDTQSPGAILAEECVVRSALSQVPSACPLHYRRRCRNTERKAGNVADWVAEHGRAWDTMVVLDADSLMSVECLLRLVDRLRTNPDLGLIQTLPVVVGARSLFARTQQFAGACYGHLYARGLAAWHGRSGNYWGHNAIVRIEAFIEAARLPILPGTAPFGGDLLSHDFVEAAFLRRAGWGVRFDADLEGSFEQAPPSLIDTIVRDRRWCQGNLQHLSVLGAKGLTVTSRLHLATGVYAYLSSPVWFALVLTGLGLALQVQLVPPDYFAKP
ncbi:MAG: glucans biosynthesis glucosyltransferase MdoH, partial [Pseudomonadota bacterium]